MRSARLATLFLGLGLLALGVGLLSRPDPEEPKNVVRTFLKALARGDHVTARKLVEGGEYSRPKDPSGTLLNRLISEQQPVLEDSQIVLDIVELTNNHAVIAARITLGERELIFPLELEFFRGLGWKIRSIDGLRVDPATVWSDIEQGVIDADPQYVDDSRLKRDLEKLWSIPREETQIASEPDEILDQPRRF